MQSDDLNIRVSKHIIYNEVSKEINKMFIKLISQRNM